MPYEALIQQWRIKPYKARPEEIRKLLRVAARDLATAERNLPSDPDSAYTIRRTDPRAHNQASLLQTTAFLLAGARFAGPPQESRSSAISTLPSHLFFPWLIGSSKTPLFSGVGKLAH